MVTRDSPWPSGTPCWVHLGVDDVSRATAFYHAVFGYEYRDMSTPEFRYVTLKLDRKEVGGIGVPGSGIPPGVPAHCSTYFPVADTDAAVATVTGAGGALTREPWDSPYGR